MIVASMMRLPKQLAALCLCLTSTVVQAQLYEPSSKLQQQLLAQAPCDVLANAFPTQVFFPGHANYTLSQSGYWSAQQTDLQPACRFFPKNAQHIQEALADVVIPRNVNIAIVSGGYSSNQGASNVAAGITFDLANITEVNFFLDAGKASWLGVGNRWKDAYPILENANLMVAGSQSASVGVGGHVLGGGYSWYSSQHGWATDSVVEIEVVTPQAEILQVSPIKSEDLFWALKGSLGAFGIVTKIKMKTFPHDGVYSGYITYQQKDMPQLCAALEFLTLEAEQDPTTQGYLNFAWSEAKQEFIYRAHLLDTDGKTTDGFFPKFKAIPHGDSTLKKTTITESAKQIDSLNPTGLRRSSFTLTATMDSATMLALHELVKDFTSKVTFDKAGVLGVTYQPLTQAHLQKQQNYFNTGTVSGPLLMIVVEFWWRDTAKDSYFEKTAWELMTQMRTSLTKRGALHPFIYPGYASREQDPYAGLAALNKKMLKSIKKKYDPDDVWKDIVPGIWHI